MRFATATSSNRDKKILLTFALCEDKFVVHILDQGRGFDLADVPDPLAEENLLKDFRSRHLPDAHVHG